MMASKYVVVDCMLWEWMGRIQNGGNEDGMKVIEVS